LEFVSWYFTNRLTDAALISTGLAAIFLLILFRHERASAINRARILIGISFLLILTWSFIPASLVLCGVLRDLYETAPGLAVRYVLGYGLLTGMIIAIPITLLVALRTPKMLLTRLGAALSEPDEETSEILARDSLQLGLKKITLRKLALESPVACTLGGRENTIVVSEGLRRLLDPDEMEAVLAHELAHVRGNDSKVNILLFVYRRILFFDPVLRLLESMVHKEREFAADEFSAFFTRKPLALASALLKIATHQPPDLSGLTALYVIGLGWYASGPQLKERVTRLILLSDRLSKIPPGGSLL
jgi:Zn-dependent protease with chaperone function